MTTPLTEQAAEYAADAAAAARGITPLETLLVRAYMAGACAAATSPEPRNALLAECVAFGKTIGTAAEMAR